MNVRIIEAKNVNVNDYRKLRLEALHSEPQAFGSAYKDHVDLPIADWQDWLGGYVEGKMSWMVFAANDRLVGMIGAFQNREDVKNKKAQIIALYVTKEVRGIGVSKLLLQALLGKLRNIPTIKTVVLDVNVNQVAAVTLYESFGFTIMGNNKPILGDGQEHEVYLMQKTL